MRMGKKEEEEKLENKKNKSEIRKQEQKICKGDRF